MRRLTPEQDCEEGTPSPQLSTSSIATGWASPSASGLQHRLQHAHRYVPSRLGVCSSPLSPLSPSIPDAPFGDKKACKRDPHDHFSKNQPAAKLHIKVTCDGPPSPGPQQSRSSTLWSHEQAPDTYSSGPAFPSDTSASHLSDGAARLTPRARSQAASWLHKAPSCGTSSLLMLWVICCIILSSNFAWNQSPEEFTLFGRGMSFATALAWMLAIPMCLAAYRFMMRMDINWASHFEQHAGATALLGGFFLIIVICLIAAPAGVFWSHPRHGGVGTALQATLEFLLTQVSCSTGPISGPASETGDAGPQVTLFKSTGTMDPVRLPSASSILQTSFTPLQTFPHLTADQQHQAYSTHSFPLPQTLHAHSHFHSSNAAPAVGSIGAGTSHQTAHHSPNLHSPTNIDKVYQSHSFPMSEASHAHNHFHDARDVLGAMSAQGHHNSPTQQHVLDHTLGLIHAPWGSVMNTTRAVAHLAWTAVDFGQGMTEVDRDTLLSLIRVGAEYLMRCNLNVDDPDSPAFAVAGAHSSAHQGHKSPSDAKPHVWLLTKDYVGADLLAGAAAALAASSMAFKNSDPGFAQHALHHASYLYSFASFDPEKLQSYCTFIPCPEDVHHTLLGPKMPSNRGSQSLRQTHPDKPHAQHQSTITEQAGIPYSSLQFKIGVHRHLQQSFLSNETMTAHAVSSNWVVSDEDLKSGQDFPGSVMDDMAWGAVWMYRATADANFLFDAQELLKSYYQEKSNLMQHHTLVSLALAVDLQLSKIQADKVHHERLHAHFGQALAHQKEIGKPTPSKLPTAFFAMAYAASSPGKASHPPFAKQLCNAMEVISSSAAAVNAAPYMHLAQQDPWIVAGSFAALLHTPSDPVAALKACQEDAEDDTML